MWRVFFITAFVFCSSACLAQSQEARVASTIGSLVIESAGLAAQIERLQQTISSQAAEIKALQEKYEPKPEAKPPGK